MADWKQAIANQAEQATQHPIVQNAVKELLDNLRLPDGGLARYGIEKVAHYAATVARAQGLGLDPDLLRLTPEEANSEIWRAAAAAVASGVPVHIVGDDDADR